MGDAPGIGTHLFPGDRVEVQEEHRTKVAFDHRVELLGCDDVGFGKGRRQKQGDPQ
jgi:hypothetical protein